MKIIKSIILILFIGNLLYSQPYTCPNNPVSGDRFVFWVHGYQANDQSLMSVSEDVECRFEAASVRNSYNSAQQSLTTSANEVESEIITNTLYQSTYGKGRNFIIGHSMGGLVARKMGMLTDANGNDLFNGLITFGTPHQGAAVADTYFNDRQSIETFLQNGCVALAEGFVAEGLDNLGALGKVANFFKFGRKILTPICDAGIPDGFDAITSIIEDGVEPELRTSQAGNIPSMATDHNAVFYGIEDGHEDGTISARMLGGITNDANTYSLYGADASDAVGIAKVDAELDKYVTNANSANSNSVRDAYQNGADWISDVGAFWNEIIGVSEVQIIKTGCECTRYDYGDPVETYVTGDENSDCVQLSNFDPDTDCYDYYEPVAVVINYSDGFILESSAKNDANSSNLDYPAQLMSGSNHVQMRNDSEMEKAIDEIFINGLGGTFFKTDPR
jgi:hypothetical protein